MFSVLHVNSFTYKGSLKLFVDPNLNENRPYIMVDWGPSIDTLFYTTTTTFSSKDAEVEYIGFFTYPSSSSIPYQIVYEDSFRVSGINNILNSPTQKINLMSKLVINPFLGNNNLPQLFYNPNNIIQSNGTYIINPSIVDFDNDSLFFKLVLSSANGFYYAKSTTIDSLTGVITSTPDTIGVYNYVLEVEEYRNSIFIGSTMFEFVVDINYVVSINELQEINLLTLYPNPTNNEVNLSIDLISNTDIKVQVYNSLGQLIHNDKFENQTGTFKHTLTLNNFSDGIYSINISINDKLISKKIIKN